MLAVAVLASALVAPVGGDAFVERIDASLARARSALLASSELADGRGTIGEQALGVLAALRAGVSATDPKISKVIARIFAATETAARDSYGGAYHAGLFLMLLEELGPRAADLGGGRSATSLAKRLVEIQRPDGGWGDVSRTEFACLGLRAAERLGERISEKVWARAEQYLAQRQLAGGGWGYSVGDPATGSMTAAACAALIAAGLDINSEPIRRGLAWFETRFRIDANPTAKPAARAPGSGGARHRFYYLASLAAFARECGEWPDPAWAVAGVRALLAEQLAGGGWKDDPQDRPTEFAILFLVEARRVLSGPAPAGGVTVGVCSSSGRPLPKGAGATLARAIGRWSDLRAEVHLRQVAPRRDGLPADDFAFVIALAGRTPFRAGDVAELTRYVEAGGTVVVEGKASLRREEVITLARRIRGGGKGAGAVADRMTLAGPAPLDPAEAPEVLLFGEGLLVAPGGVFRFADRKGTPGARSVAERAAANAFALAVSQ